VHQGHGNAVPLQGARTSTLSAAYRRACVYRYDFLLNCHSRCT